MSFQCIHLSLVWILLFLVSSGYCLEEIALDDLPRSAVIELIADLDHVQGIAVDDSSFWVTSVNRKVKTGHLHHFDSRTGKLINQIELQEGELYHPGGLSADGDFLWIPVAAYRRESEAVIQCRDKTTLKQVSQFHVNDHIGCLAVNGEQLIGGNWDSLLLYFWDKQGHLLKKIDNPTKTAYQDIKCREGRLIASGLLDDRGCIDWIDLADMQPTKRLWGGNTDRGVSFMHEGMAVHGDRLFLMPEDGPSRVFVFQMGGGKKVEIQPRENGFQLYRDGKPHSIQGAVYWADPAGIFPLEDFVTCGGNSVRIGGSNVERIMEKAAQLGVSVTLGLPVRGEYTSGFDYDDEKAVRQQFDRVREMVLKYKDHPALLMWGVGNELSLWYKNTKVWDALNDICKMIHELDPHHPTMTATGDNPFDRPFFDLLKETCPELDILGVNIYKGLEEIPAKLRELGWTKPYVITEWGPSGHWQVPKTPWKSAIEETSTEKAMVYKQRYETIRNDPMCLGGYVFFWGNKQEQTHTWYGMFLETGERTGAVNGMQYLWTGKWPENLEPRIESFTVNEKKPEENIYLHAGDECKAVVRVIDPESDPLAFHWEILPEPKQYGYGGRGEKKPEAVSGLILDLEEHGGTIRFKSPPDEGAYRLFVTVRDGNRNAAVANIPFFVK